MFSSLSEKFQNIFSRLRGHRTLTEANVADAVEEVRLALLEADVHFGVALRLIERVKEKALGDQVLKSVKPGQQFMKLVHDELTALMGSDEAPLDLQGKVSVVMLCGLQGSGKTTTAAKLGVYLRGERRKVLLAACDLQRPAAVQQLKKLGEETGISVFSREGVADPLQVAKEALGHAKEAGFDVLLVDTAGRLHLDEALMEELSRMKALLEPREILFVANATMGHVAVDTAASFHQRVGITGTILTMLDGNARAGAALSIREITGKPLRFEGVGEKVSDLVLFHPRSMADRILGMGDVINLVKKVEKHIDQEEGKKLEEKIRKASFTYDDYLKQMGMMKKMGSFSSLLQMVPGMSQVGQMTGGMDFSDAELKKMEAMIFSMTSAERGERVDLTHHRRKRIALGSGLPLDEVNRMVKGFQRVKQQFRNFPDMKGSSKLKELFGLNACKEEDKNRWL